MYNQIYLPLPIVKNLHNKYVLFSTDHTLKATLHKINEPTVHKIQKEWAPASMFILSQKMEDNGKH